MGATGRLQKTGTLHRHPSKVLRHSAARLAGHGRSAYLLANQAYDRARCQIRVDDSAGPGQYPVPGHGRRATEPSSLRHHAHDLSAALSEWEPKGNLVLDYGARPLAQSQRAAQPTSFGGEAAWRLAEMPGVWQSTCQGGRKGEM
ncbi:hypothetical protein VFPFJ_07635 [Purpureocillium lilacinum]|uniref:Uncharacterized protein n=1 Tax=Purpureocillium lilacinum TaxID=33203 RepID=A0A179H4Y5_PURLI|nr:hypothetical protein VFPFJ_07635 [Purpureocillium lilacinum]OAQ85246.1 hypothetical protein VFPFJ_07635 [Purpureocillium lilacinum]